MTIHHPKIRFLIFTIVTLVLAGCESEQQTSAAENAVNPPGQEQVIKVPLPRDTPPVAEQQALSANPPTQADATPLPTISSASREDDGYIELEWDTLIPEDYRPDAIISKYMEQLAELDDSSPIAQEIFGKIQAELDNAPINEKLNGKKVKLPGFIAPLESNNGKVSEFLLVPYFGACIHVPPPPINQTVLVKTRPDSALSTNEVENPFWVKGILLTEGESTDIGSAGYRIEQAETEEFE